MKKIEDYLHLYPDCEVVFLNEKTKVENYGEFEKARITGLFQCPSGAGLMAQLCVDDWEEPLEVLVEEIKMALRPISKLTKDEMVELWNSIFWYKFTANGRFQRFDKKTTSADPRWVLMEGLERLGIEDNGTVWADCDLSHHKHNQHEVTRWFLSKKIDLFQLIEAGLAVDVTTLTVQECDATK